MPAAAEDPTVSLYEEIEAYLNTLENNVPESTFASQKSVLTDYADWYRETQGFTTPCEQSAAKFLEYADKNQAPATLNGYGDVLANFCAYLWRDDPEITRARINRHFGSDTSESRGTTDETCHAIISLVQYLRRCSFGSRIHACIELQLDAKCRLAQLHDLTLSNIDFQTKTVELPIGNTHLVGRAGIVDSRIEPLGDSVDVLKEYFEYERVDPASNHCPLFTTSQGRASTDTLRRELHDATGTDQRHGQEPTFQQVSFHDIWEYSLYDADQ